MKFPKNWLSSTGVTVSLAAFMIRSLGVTLHVKISDPNALLSRNRKHQCIFAFWHNRILMMPFFFEKFVSSRSLCVMISRSRDGQFITDVAGRFGVHAARGSSSKHGSQAFREISKALESHHCDAAITPDGPRGPRYSVHPGVIRLASHLGIPIVPVSYHLSHKIELPSWDRFQVPLPFARCTIHFGPCLSIPQELKAEDESRYGENLQKALQNLGD